MADENIPENRSLPRRIFEIIKKPTDSVDDIWLGISKKVKNLDPRISSYLIGILGVFVHTGEGIKAAKEYEKAATDSQIGQQKLRKAVAATTMLISCAGSSLAITLLIDTIGLIDTPAIELFPFLISGLLALNYTINVLRKQYTLSEEENKSEINALALKKAKREFNFGAGELIGSSVSLFGLMLGTERYFDGLKGLAGESLTENASYIIFVGAFIGVTVKIWEDIAERSKEGDVKISQDPARTTDDQPEGQVTTPTPTPTPTSTHSNQNSATQDSSSSCGRTKFYRLFSKA